ncbi:MAG: hypothetical protein ABL984_16110 [Pyrinomonadaceae bacterium]
MNNDTTEAVRQQQFHEYMLKEMDMSYDYSKHLLELDSRSTNLHLSLFVVLAGAAATIVASKGATDAYLLVGTTLIILGITGCISYRRKLENHVNRTCENEMRVGMHEYFRELNRSEFDKWGGSLMVEKHKSNLESMWTIAEQSGRLIPNFQGVGAFAILNALMVAIGAEFIGFLLLELLIENVLRSYGELVFALTVAISSLGIMLTFFVFFRLTRRLASLRKEANEGLSVHVSRIRNCSHLEFEDSERSRGILNK